jgi:putative phosphoesterase
MRIAVLSDIHGNIDALEAVLSDCRKLSPDAYVFLGDLVFLGLYPQKCFDALSAIHPMLCIKGNTDANMEEVDTFCPSNTFEQQVLDCVVDCHGRLSEQAKTEIASWPIAHNFVCEGKELVFCHGSPFSFSDKLTPLEQIDQELANRLTREEIQEICCGHTHTPADFFSNSTHIVNVGAVGFSFDGDTRAAYGMIEIDDTHVAYQIIRVRYNRDRYLSELRHISERLPLFNSIVYAVETGTPKPNWR